MSYYYTLGKTPPKRHTQFRQPNQALYKEELVSSKGFSGIYSNLYHIYPPTQIKQREKSTPIEQGILQDYPLQHTHLKTASLDTTGEDFLSARCPLLRNQDVVLSLCHPQGVSMDYYYKNGEADEVIFVHEGEGTMYSQFGALSVKKGDYIVIPRTTIYRLEWKKTPKLLIIECMQPVETVERYRNALGQLEEHSPYCERDLHPPQTMHTESEKGNYRVKIKKGGYIHHYLYAHSPCDLVGWDGFLYPYTFSIYDFEPITGRIHQPPPVHQTFQTQQLVICSFVPRMFDYHPKAIPVPYNHSNIDSDEVLYYFAGNFMSRKGIEEGSFTLHPGGLPHGPHPGTVEKSLGAKETKEYAVMIDTFRPLFLSTQAQSFIDPNYPMSWSN